MSRGAGLAGPALLLLAILVPGEAAAAPKAKAAGAHEVLVRARVSGFGAVVSEPAGLSCGSVAADAKEDGTRCVATIAAPRVRLHARPFNARFRFAGWSGGAAACGNTNPCNVDLASHSAGLGVRARFVPASSTVDVCEALGLVGDRNNHPQEGPPPSVKPGEAYVDKAFGTTIRRITDVLRDGRADSRFLVPAYSTVAAWNADETLLVLYRTGGRGRGSHELYGGKDYRFIRTLDDLPLPDIEQFYWHTTRPNIILAIDSGSHQLVEYDVAAPEGRRVKPIRDFSAECQGAPLKSSPYFTSWDSRVIGLTCGETMFSYDLLLDKAGQLAKPPRWKEGGYNMQVAPSGTRLFFIQPDGKGSTIGVFDLDMKPGPLLDMGAGHEHAGVSMLSDGSDTFNSVQFDRAPGGTGVGTLLQWNLTQPVEPGQRIPGRVLIGRANGYPYPPGGTHIGGTAYHRTGLLGVSVRGKMTGTSLLDGELIYIDTDYVTNPRNAVCRVGHHRTASKEYFAEPHVAISPSGTRLLFGSSWGDPSATPIIDTFVVELPGYRGSAAAAPAAQGASRPDKR